MLENRTGDGVTWNQQAAAQAPTRSTPADPSAAAPKGATLIPGTAKFPTPPKSDDCEP